MSEKKEDYDKCPRIQQKVIQFREIDLWNEDGGDNVSVALGVGRSGAIR